MSYCKNILREVMEISEGITDAELIQSIVGEMLPYFSDAGAIESVDRNRYILAYRRAMTSIHSEIREMVAWSIILRIDSDSGDQWLLNVVWPDGIKDHPDPVVRRSVAVTAKTFKDDRSTHYRLLAELAFDSEVEIRRIALTELFMSLTELVPSSRRTLQDGMEKLDEGDTNPELLLTDAVNAVSKRRIANLATRNFLLSIRNNSKTPRNLRLVIDAKLNQSDNILRKFVNVISAPFLFQTTG